jgi:hypothetical protein
MISLVVEPMIPPMPRDAFLSTAGAVSLDGFVHGGPRFSQGPAINLNHHDRLATRATCALDPQSPAETRMTPGLVARPSDPTFLIEQDVMRVLDPGHRYALPHLDGDGETTLQFVKREGAIYPGNVGHHEGVNMQEILRALIDRAVYLDTQIPADENILAISYMKLAVHALESRAAHRHGRQPPDVEQSVYGETCGRCGHVGCDGKGHRVA